MTDDEPEEHDTTSLYVSEDVEELSFAQIAMASAKDPDVTVEETDEGYLVNGELFTPAVDDEFDT